VESCFEDLCNCFGNFKYGKVSGHKFFDADGDEIWDLGELGLQHWRINLKDDTGTVIDSTTTDANGFYEFTGIEVGDYTIEEELIVSWWEQTATSPAS
jgi:hypothetical protein